ncbi:CNNM domain-containing protein, partial [uncultured Abyssibacter sp.]|uniref:CNNM domain-containing protein n=1 Tax=uncultured Abyssibacter sp. TaxID=2320202 RepID=UPI0032B1BC65
MLSLLIVFFLVSIVFSFLCSMWEAVLLSVTPAYSRIQEEQGTAIGRQLRIFKDNIDKPLAAILTLNTIAHTVGAIGVGDQAAKLWADANPIITVLVVPGAMTLGILVLSEIIPKTIGATHWQRLAPFTVRSLQFIGGVMAPLVWLSQIITRRLKSEEHKSVLSRNDFLAMTDIVQEQGALHASESSIIKNLLRFRDITARDVMTPRVVVVAAPEEMTVEAFHASVDSLRFSRIPCYVDGSTDHMTGYVLKDDILEALLAGEAGRTLG